MLSDYALTGLSGAVKPLKKARKSPIFGLVKHMLSRSKSYLEPLEVLFEALEVRSERKVPKKALEAL